MNNKIVADLNTLNIDTSNFSIQDVNVESKDSKDRTISIKNEQGDGKFNKEIVEITPLEEIKLQLLIKQTKFLKSIKYMILILVIIVLSFVIYDFLMGAYEGFTDVLSMGF